ncbi:FtsQ-type POTRA domain-containing protein [Microbacterium sp. SORGH_AS_0862]|uniref:FtsQ-type POTRA domain-containing protein n=1 Tax=Microbacterium sp. SORGH_AS_0862 TaxID=3041789 RepID=UPI0027905881|nr:FtsQ-type POTRA domain-containing protein [Microbacterium sp. SORGH_AS_0862]MDQ1203788.1 cell division protein FtsQ [Microbacterium sp. SORGH_AS_0862]
MRRPSPLPPQGGKPADAPLRARPATPPREDAPRPAAHEDLQETAPIAPLFPAPGASATPKTDTAPAGGGEDLARPDSDTAPVGWRDVWRAARSRRKALRAEVRRFTVRQRRRRIIWLSTAASLVLVTIATVGAAYSPLFAVQQITVVGTSQLAAADVEAALDGQRGTPLAAIDASSIKAALVAFPLVESYTLEARPPHELVVRIVERTPIGVISGAAGYTLVDAAGVALSTSPTPQAGYPLVDAAGGEDGVAFAAIGRTMRALPADLRAQVTQVEAKTADDVTLTLGGTNTRVVWGSADESALKALVLQKLTATRPPDGVAVYDVSSPEVPVIR